jgi:hypothetical protein
MNSNGIVELKVNDFKKDILDSLLNRANVISTLRNDNMTNIDLICTYSKEIEEIELPIKVKVEQESETSKDKSLSTIDKREKEVLRRLNENVQYKDKLQKIKDLKRTNSENDVMISYNRRVINIYLVFGKESEL